MNNLETKASGAFDVIIEIPATLRIDARIEADSLEEAHAEGRAFAMGLSPDSNELKISSMNAVEAFIPHCSRVDESELQLVQSSYTVKLYGNEQAFSERVAVQSVNGLALADAEDLLSSVEQGRSAYFAASMHRAATDERTVVNRFGRIFVASVAPDGKTVKQLLKGWFNDIVVAKLAALDFLTAKQGQGPVAVFLKQNHEDEPVVSVVLFGGD